MYVYVIYFFSKFDPFEDHTNHIKRFCSCKQKEIIIMQATFF